MNWETLYNVIRARFKEQVEVFEGVVVHYDNVPQPTEIDSDPWIRLTIKPSDMEQVSIGGTTNRFRTSGIAIAQIMEPLQRGMNAALELADAVKDAFRAVTVSGVVFRAPGMVNVGRSGEYWQVNVICPFWADDLA